MTLGTVEVAAFCATILVLLYYYCVATFNFWKSRGVNGPKPVFFFGTTKDVLLGKLSSGLYYAKIYKEYKNEPMVGVFSCRTPYLILTDPDLIRDVLIKDFFKFAERTLIAFPKVEPLSQQLNRLDAVKWRPLRVSLSPVFTSGKLKEMFHLLLECADHFEKYLDTIVAQGEPVECRELTAKFTTDVIGSCAFGIEMNAMSAENSDFRKMGDRIFRANWKTVLRDRMREVPTLFKIFGPLVIDNELVRFFVRITREVIEYRIRNNVRRHDFIDALVELKKHPEKLGVNELDDSFVAAQAFIFFAAGFETSSVTMSNAIYELALNHAIQDKVRNEIKETISVNGGTINYEMIPGMKYLNSLFQETLRKYPPVLYVDRLALTNYTFEGTKVTIPKGQRVFIPVLGIHHDPVIYPDPEIFDPDRFNEENIKSRHPMYHLPFGDGPRKCIGARFANYQSKVGLIKILTKWRIDVCEKTQVPYIVDRKMKFLLQPDHGIYVKMTKIEDD